MASSMITMSSISARRTLMSCLCLRIVLFALLDTVLIHGVNNEAVEFTISEPQVITSPDYPGCCKPVKYILKKEATKKYLKGVFTDVDLPPTSSLLIFGVEANDTRVPLSSARYLKGTWIHPVVFYEGNEVLLEFHASKRSEGTKRYVGFNGTFWADDDPWELDKPLTSCPPTGDVMEGGRVTFKDVLAPLDAQHHRLYCVWLLKPVPGSDLSVYINVEKLSGVDTNLEIREGVTSSSPVVHSSSEINSPLKLTSAYGFYIKLTRPIENSKFAMTHGVLKSFFGSGDKCSFFVDGNSVDGYRCGGWNTGVCIPVENKCNSIPDCPGGEDELPATCVKTTTTVAPKATTADDCLDGRCKDGRCPDRYRLYYQEKCPEEDCGDLRRRCKGTLYCVYRAGGSCPGEPCKSSRRQCADGMCIAWYESCEDGSVPCQRSYRRCKAGNCLASYERCPEDECPSYKTLECDRKCLYESAKCDGVKDCSSGIDEQNCPLFSGASKKKLIWVVIAVPLFVILVCIAYKVNKNRNAATDETSANVGERAAERQHMNPSPRTSGIPAGNGRSSAPPADSFLLETENNSEPNANNQSPSAPPDYGDVMDNREMYVPPAEPPPDYSSATADPAV